MAPFLIISRADVDKAYVWALHSSVTGTLRVKGNKYLVFIKTFLSSSNISQEWQDDNIKFVSTRLTNFYWNS